jgi:hypothetical protein
MKDLTVNRFRTARGRVLRQQIERLAKVIGRPVTILDVGGRPDYWNNVGLDHDHVAEIRLLNNDPDELDRETPSGLFTSEIGDARCLTNYRDKSIDLVHSNSVIEHVGLWADMEALAREAVRVGVSGWVQTPAWEFPIEPHFRLPFMHWFATPVRRAMLSASRDYASANLAGKRHHVERINLLSSKEFRALFPQADIFVERVILPKSYSARWGPAGVIS